MHHPYKADVSRLEPTDEDIFCNRRAFIRSSAAGLIAAGATGAAVTALHRRLEPQDEDDAKILTPPLQRPDVFPPQHNDDFAVPDGIRDALTDRLTAATHNNFYEFLPGRGGPVWQFTEAFEVEPWTIEVTGACHKPRTIDLDELFKFDHEERIYHFRCVERWAMNVPWCGFPLKKLLDAVEPTGDAKFVRFVTANRPEQMPGIRPNDGYAWPYHEGLRMDEAMHDLTLVTTGVYGKPLLKQHGAPVRVIVPWKYGYKSPKSIVKIELVREQPPTFWSAPAYRHEYGFLSNVNPNIPHPRWSQAQSYWLGTRNETFETPIFNGYAEAVAGLYPDEPRTPQEPLRRGQIAR